MNDVLPFYSFYVTEVPPPQPSLGWTTKKKEGGPTGRRPAGFSAEFVALFLKCTLLSSLLPYLAFSEDFIRNIPSQSHEVECGETSFDLTLVRWAHCQVNNNRLFPLYCPQFAIKYSFEIPSNEANLTEGQIGSVACQGGRGGSAKVWLSMERTKEIRKCVTSKIPENRVTYYVIDFEVWTKD